MHRIADQQEARLVPPQTTAGFDRQQSEQLPVPQRLDMLSEVRLQLHDDAPHRFYSDCLHLLVLTLGKDEPYLPVVEPIEHH